MSRARTPLWILLALLPAGLAGADVLAPRSGPTVQGAIVSRTESEVVFNIYWSRNPGVTNPEHIFRLPMTKVKRVEEAPHPEVEIFRRLKKAGTADELTAAGDYARDHKLKAHARVAYALALAKDDTHAEALKGIGGRAKWESVRKGNPLLDPGLQALLDRYVTLDAPDERVALQKEIRGHGFDAKPFELERYRRGALQPKGYQEDRPMAYGSGDHPGAVYTLFVPEAYTPARPWPLIIGLHGGGADGKKGDEVVGSGPSAMNFYRQHAARHGFLVACPTAPTAPWQTPQATQLVRNLIVEMKLLYHVDIDRIYMTGHSMGGFGTWSLGPLMAEDLAAISPMAGGGSGVSRLVATRTPIFIYHSDNDYVSVSNDRAAAKQLLDSDLDFVYTELPGQGHGFPPSIQDDLFAFFEPRRRFDKKSKEAWPRSSFLGKVTKEEALYLGDPMDELNGVVPDLKAWLADLNLGGGRALSAAARIAEQKPDGAVEGVAKVLGSKTAPFDGRAYAARALGLLALPEGAAALRRAVAQPASKEQSLVAEACAEALAALHDVEATDALGKAIEAWATYYEDKVVGKAMRFSDWQRATRVLAALAAAWAGLAGPDARTTVLERVVVERVLLPQHEVETSERVPQDPSVTRTALAAAVARAYKRTNADAACWARLNEAVANDPKAAAAVETAQR